MSMSNESLYRLIRDHLLRAEDEVRRANGLTGSLDPSEPDAAELYKEVQVLERRLAEQCKPLRKRLHRMIYREEGYDENGGLLPARSEVPHAR